MQCLLASHLIIWMIVCIGFGVACALQASIADTFGFLVGNLLCLVVLMLAFAIFNVAFACYYLCHLLICFLALLLLVYFSCIWCGFAAKLKSFPLWARLLIPNSALESFNQVNVFFCFPNQSQWPWIFTCTKESAYAVLLNLSSHDLNDIMYWVWCWCAILRLPLLTSWSFQLALCFVCWFWRWHLQSLMLLLLVTI